MSNWIEDLKENLNINIKDSEMSILGSIKRNKTMYAECSDFFSVNDEKLKSDILGNDGYKWHTIKLKGIRR